MLLFYETAGWRITFCSSLLQGIEYSLIFFLVWLSWVGRTLVRTLRRRIKSFPLCWRGKYRLTVPLSTRDGLACVPPCVCHKSVYPDTLWVWSLLISASPYPELPAWRRVRNGGERCLWLTILPAMPTFLELWLLNNQLDSWSKCPECPVGEPRSKCSAP